MPSTVRPDLPRDVELAIDALGNRVRVAALRSLTIDGPATGTDLARRLDISRSILHKHLGALEGLGLVSPHPPREEPGRIRRTYSVSPSAVQQLLTALVGALQQDTEV